jgi:hypothetical protein
MAKYRSLTARVAPPRRNHVGQSRFLRSDASPSSRSMPGTHAHRLGFGIIVIIEGYVRAQNLRPEKPAQLCGPAGSQPKEI